MRSSYRFLVIVVATLVVLFLAGRYIWPTPYRYVNVNGTLLRIDRVEGRGDMLDPDKGWIPIPEAPPPYRPVTASRARP